MSIKNNVQRKTRLYDRLHSFVSDYSLGRALRATGKRRLPEEFENRSTHLHPATPAVFGGNPDGTRFVLVKCPHEFGTYLDIKFFYDDEDQRHVVYMNHIETGCEKWDQESGKELEERGYRMNQKFRSEIL